MTSSFGGEGCSEVISTSDVSQMTQLERILSSQLITRLLPKLFANIVILVCNFAVPAYEVLALVQNLLPLLTSAQRMLNANNNNNNKQDSDKHENDKEKTFTSLVVESHHPYQSGKVQQYRARFPDAVSYMTVEFDRRCQTAQKEDYLQVYAKRSASKEYERVQVLNKMSLDENWPMESVVIPGNELEFVMMTSSDYQKNLDKKPTSFYGFRCLVTGYDNGPHDVIDPVTCLINEMISCCGEAVNMLMSMEEEFLPCEGIQADDETTETTNDKTSTTKLTTLGDKLAQFRDDVGTSMKDYDQFLSQSFHLESFPNVQSVLTDTLPLNKSCPEKRFLFDFIQADSNTSGGKLARWLQPESYVDPPSCLLQVHSASLIESLPTSITILTRDQNGTPVHVPSLGVELQARSQRLVNGDQIATPSELPSPSHMPLPSCEYKPVTKYPGFRYHSISMMSEYKDFSFEEIRLAIPQAEKITVNRAKDGMYRAKWTPSCSGSYKLQVVLDGQLKGPSVVVDVQPPLDGATEQAAASSSSSSSSASNNNRLLKFVKKDSKGIRLRSKPSLLSPQIALLNNNDVIEYDEEISNGDGKWVRLTKESIKKYCGDEAPPSEGFCLRYNKLSQKTLLLPASSSSTEQLVAAQHRDVEVMKSSIGSMDSSADEQPVTVTTAAAMDACSSSGSSSDMMMTSQHDKLKEEITAARLRHQLTTPTSGGNLPNMIPSPHMEGDVYAVMIDQVRTSTQAMTSQARTTSLNDSMIRLSQSDPGILGGGKSLSQEASPAICKFKTPLEFKSPPEFKSPEIPLSLRTRSRTSKKKVSTTNDHKKSATGSCSVKKRSSQSLASGLPSATRRKTSGHTSGGSSNNSSSSSTTKRPFNPTRSLSSSKRSSTASPTPKRSASTTNKKAADHDHDDEDLPRNKVIRGRRNAEDKHEVVVEPSASDNIPFIDDQFVATDTDNVDSEGNVLTSSSSAKVKEFLPPKKVTTTSSKPKRSIPHKLALAPSTAECIRSVFAAFLWHEKLVEDAVVSSKYLQTNASMTRQDALQSSSVVTDEQNGVGEGPGTSGTSAGTSGVVIPPSISYLATLWQSISAQVTKSANQSSMGDDLLIKVGPTSTQVVATRKAPAATGSRKRKDNKKVVIAYKNNLLQRKQNGGGGGLMANYPFFQQGGNQIPPPLLEPRLFINPPLDLLNGDHEDLLRGGLNYYGAGGGGRIHRNRGGGVDDNRRYGMLQARQMINHAAELFQGVPRFDAVGGGGADNRRFQAARNLRNAAIPFALRQPPLPPAAGAAAADPILRRPRRPLGGAAGGGDVIADYYRMWNNLVLPPPPQVPAAAGFGGQSKKNSRSICEMCAEEHDYPVTKHMEKIHPGCKMATDGMGFNHRGQYSAGWIGACGTNTSKVYIMCKKCKEKNTKLSTKKASSASSSKPSKKNKSYKNNEEKDLTSVYKIFRDNAMFLLELDRSPASNCTNLANKAACGPLDYLTDRVNDEENGLFGIIDLDDKSVDDLSIESRRQQDRLPSSATGPCFFPSIACNFINKIRSEMEQHELPPHEFRVSTPEDSPTKSFNFSAADDQGSHKMKNDDAIADDVGEMEHQQIDDVMNETDVMTSQQPPTSLDLNLNVDARGHVTVNSPSAQLLSMMKKSQNNSQSKNKNTMTTAVEDCSIVNFISVKHHLKSLRIILSLTQRKAIMRVYGLQALTWLLRIVNDEEQVHAVMWYFVTATTAKQQPTDDVIQIRRHKSEHPVDGVINAGGNILLLPLVEAFHGFLQSVADVITNLPTNSSAQLMAIRCWDIRFLPVDHNFFHFSDIFSHINKILSSNHHHDVIKPEAHGSSRVEILNDITSNIEVLPSSHKAIAGSLIDGSTETFWESGDQDKNRMKTLVLSSGDPNNICIMEEVWIHIDNTRDAQKKVTKVTFSACDESECWRPAINQSVISPQLVGWIECRFVTGVKKIRIELRGPDNCVRVRQVRVFGSTNGGSEPNIHIQPGGGEEIFTRKNEVEMIHIFRLLTTEIFGQLLSHQDDDDDDVIVATEIISDVIIDGKVESVMSDEQATVTSAQTLSQSSSTTSLMRGENLRDEMAKLLDRKPLTSLQLKIFAHIVSAIGGEAARIRLAFRCNPKLLIDSPDIISDKYCHELLSMLLRLSGNPIGCEYISQQNAFIKDLLSLLHTATPRIQKQVTTLWKRILPKISPQQLADVLQLKLPHPEKILNYLKKNDCEELSTSGTPPNDDDDDDIPSIFDPFLAFIAKSISVQLKGISGGKSPQPSSAGDKSKQRIQTIDMQSSLIDRYSTREEQLWWMQGGKPEKFVVESVVKLMYDVIHNEMGAEWSNAAKSCISRALLQLTRLGETARQPDNCVGGHPLWLALAALCVLDDDHVEKLSSAKRMSENKPTCDNHDDGETPAIIQCDTCGNLCAECDRFLHLNRRTRQHQRQVFKEEEESIRVDLHEGCGRLKLFWFLALADSRTLKAVVEFKSRNIDGRPSTSSVVSGCCRFCGTKNESLALTSVCADVTCQQLAAVACSKTLTCGHHCCGVKNEENCLECLYSTCSSDLKQDADDMCMICFTDALSAAPSIKLDCGHIFHYLCYEILLKKKWTGPRITFGFMNCSICKMEVSHVSLEKYLSPLRELKKEVEGKALQRLEYEGLIDCESISSTRSKFHKNPLLYALDKYAYYVCHKCNKAYYGGDVRCDVEANLNEENFDSRELICGACSNISCAQICDKHGTDFLEYKCRYCCSVAVYFCFGTTHFCRVCHDDFQRIVNVSKDQLPSCPAGPGARQLECPECPLHLTHPPTGQEFALGCGVCRNAHTF